MSNESETYNEMVERADTFDEDLMVDGPPDEDSDVPCYAEPDDYDLYVLDDDVYDGIWPDDDDRLPYDTPVITGHDPAFCSSCPLCN